nr:multi-sensor hybrid histidine kinase [uncultured bacterium]
MKILLLEDHEPSRTALVHLLKRRNYEVYPAGSIAEARAIVSAQKIDLLMSDLGLPDGDGNDFMAELEANRGLSGIALTGYGMEEDIQRSLAAGFMSHLIKPVLANDLENALRAFTSNQAG